MHNQTVEILPASNSTIQLQSETPLPVTYESILAAANRIEGYVVRTPTVPAVALNPLFATQLSLKLENLQRIGAFKERGALNKLLQLTKSQAAAGVIAVSAGNHAQAVAYHAQRLGLPATIVMPAATPFVKIERTASYGARVVLEGNDLTETEDAAKKIADAEGLTNIHPYDDIDIIAGQGTIALELLADAPDLDAIIVPVGGGGLIAGIAVAAKAIKPDIKIFGVQVDSYATMRSHLHGTPQPRGGATLAEGIAVKRPGKLTSQIISALVEDLITVPESEIERAIYLLVDAENIVAEGAGAAGIAAIMGAPQRWSGRRVATIICGGNIDHRMLASVLMRGLVRGRRLVRIRAEIDDKPGMLAQLCNILAAAAANIIEITHQRLSIDVPIKNSEVDVVIETRNEHHVSEILERLKDGGFPTKLIGIVI